MRILNVLRNSMYSFGSFMFIALIGIVVRKFFTMYLQIELLGMEGLFSNIVQMLSLAELGLSSIISYGLYRELANDNKSEVNILMNIYRYIYMLIGGLITIVSIVLFFFLPQIVPSTTVSWKYVEVVYVIQVGTILTSYFLAYRRTLFAADQKDYVCIKIDTFCSFLNNGVRLIAICVFQNYMIYAIAGLLFNILANIIISFKAKTQYPYLKKVNVTFEDIKKRNFFSDVKNLMVHKISTLLYGGSDAIIVSSILGLHVMGIYSNYCMIHMGIFNVLYKVLQGIVPSIGNLVYGEDLPRTIKIYRMLDMVYVLFAGYMCCIYIIAFQPFMNLFFGKQFLLPYSLIVFLGGYVFLMIQFENACNFRNTSGDFDNDRNYMIISALTKIGVSIPAIYYFGIVGLLWGSIIGWLFIGYGRVQFVFRKILYMDIQSYLLKHLVWSIITCLEIYLIYFLLGNRVFASSYWEIIINCILAFILMTIFQGIIFRKTEEFRDICKYMINIKSMISNKFKT